MTPTQMARLAKAEGRMRQGYQTLLFAHPYYAHVLYSHRRVADPRCKTLWIDGRTLGYNPEFVLTLPIDELAGGLAHAAGHICGLHHIRREGRDPEEWNIACDHIVNYIVEQSGLKLPKGCLKGIGGTTPEAIYAQRMQDKQDGGSGTNQQSAPPQPGQGQPQQGQGQGGQGQPQPGSPGDEKAEEQSFGEVRDQRNADGTEMAAEEREMAEQQARIMIAQAVRTAQQYGRLPGHLQHFTEKILAPKLDWREVLSRWHDNFAKTDWSWQRPNLRYMSATRAILPSLSTPAYGRTVLFIDTSGSMSNAIIDQLCGEVKQCIATYAEQGVVPELYVGWADTQVTFQIVTDEDELLTPVGRGGTDYADAFASLEREGLTPQGVIYATDGYCNSFGEEPSCPVLWIVTSACDFRPPFGEVVHMEERLA